MTAPGAPPASCDYETASGGACPNRARWKLTIADGGARPSISGEPVRYFAHACHYHRDEARAKLPHGSLKIESEEAL
jgi:hypothetical protein